MPEPPRILVVKTSSLGDVVHALPAVSDIAAARPDAVIDWVCEEGFAGIPAMHSAVANVIPCAIRRWRRSWWRSSTRREIAMFRASLRRAGYDIAIDFQGLIKSGWIVHGARATRHGYGWSSAREPLSTLAYDVRHRVAWGQHAIVRNRQLASLALGYAPQGPARYGLALPPEWRADATSADGSPTVIALHATSRIDKAWPEDRWRALVERMSARGYAVLLPWGSEGEAARSQRLADGVAGARVPPRMDMRSLARLFAASAVVVGVDTGLVHLAAAAGAPVVAIFGPTDPMLTGVVGERAVAIAVGGNGDMPDVDRVLAAIAATAWTAASAATVATIATAATAASTASTASTASAAAPGVPPR